MSCPTIKKAIQITLDSKKNLEIAIEETKEIGKIVEVSEAIRAIAAQTNLLALNASIEAARTDEAGNGFVVVANEIKNLSNTTGNEIEKVSNVLGTHIGNLSVSVTNINEIIEMIDVSRKELDDLLIDLEMARTE